MYDFFERQAQARSATRKLMGLLFLSVLAVLLAVNLAVYITVSADLLTQSNGLSKYHELINGFAPFLISGPGLWVSIATLLVIGGGSAFRMIQLAGSADKVAKMLGGKRIDPQAPNAPEKRLLNVVEEMAIAAGMKVPRVYILYHEQGINAFAAGLNPNDAIIAVTRGALESLSRDELQGVVAHEFSHILNSDMRLNTQLIGLLAGILLIGKIGQHLMESSSSSVNNRKGNAGLLGLLLVVIGAVGLFLGQLIKAAISRQREFLADASAVQFTRFPEGIGMALMKIRKSLFGSTLTSPEAEDVSHMCFGAGKRPMLASLLATHPPIDERIRAIDPALLNRDVTLGPGPDIQGDTAGPIGQHDTAFDMSDGTMAGFSQRGHAAHREALVNKNAVSIKSSIGTINDEALSAGVELHAGIPEALMEAAHNPQTAGILLCAIASAAPQRPGQACPRAETPSASAFSADQKKLLAMLTTLVVEGSLQIRIPLTQILMTTLESLDGPAREKTLIMLREVINQDGSYSLTECSIYLVAQKYLGNPSSTRRQINSLSAVQTETLTLLHALAHASGKPGEERTKDLTHAVRCLGINPEIPIPKLSAVNLSQSVQTLARLSPLLKRSLVDTAVDMVVSDKKVTLAEFELVRCFCDLLDCPVPAAMKTYGQ